MQQQPFQWFGGSTVKLSAGTTSSAVNLAPAAGDSFQIRLFNSGSVPVFIARGAVATTADMPIMPNSVEVLTVSHPDPSIPPQLAGITASGSADLYITAGEGF